MIHDKDYDPTVVNFRNADLELFFPVLLHVSLCSAFICLTRLADRCLRMYSISVVSVIITVNTIIKFSSLGDRIMIEGDIEESDCWDKITPIYRFHR